jgi:hypothetical protein
VYYEHHFFEGMLMDETKKNMGSASRATPIGAARKLKPQAEEKPKPNRHFSDAVIDKLRSTLAPLGEAEKTRKGLLLADLGNAIHMTESAFGHVWNKRTQLDAFQFYVLPTYVATKLGIPLEELLPPAKELLPPPPPSAASSSRVSGGIEAAFIQECYSFVKQHFDDRDSKKTDQTLFDTTHGVLRIIADREIALAPLDPKARQEQMRTALDEYLVRSHR